MAFLCQAAATGPSGLSVSQCPRITFKFSRSELGWAGEMVFCGSWGACLLGGGGDGTVTACLLAHADPRRQGTCECSHQSG